VFCRETQCNDATSTGSDSARVGQPHGHDAIEIPSADDKIEEILDFEITTKTFFDCPKGFKFDNTTHPTSRLILVEREREHGSDFLPV
jgi:hypothetical protein